MDNRGTTVYYNAATMYVQQSKKNRNKSPQKISKKKSRMSQIISSSGTPVGTTATCVGMVVE